MNEPFIHLWPCQFCGSQNAIQMYDSHCKTCQVNYHVNQPTPFSNPGGQWKLFGITYQLIHDPTYSQLVMHLDTEFTIIWPRSSSSAQKIVIPRIFHLPKPQDAAKLAHRLASMKVFS